MAESIRRPEWMYRGRGALPHGKLEFRHPQPVGADDLELCGRLIAAYHAALEARTDKGYSGIWAWIFDAQHQILADALECRDPERLAEVLASMFQQDFVLGISAGSLARHGRSLIGRQIWWLKSLDGLLSVAEALGAVPAESPEQGSLGGAFNNGVERLVEALEARVGFRIDFPNVGAPFGIAAGSRLITIDTPEQVYAAERLAAAIRLTGSAARRVVEIGAGYGGMAYWYLQSRPDIDQYTIVDLPPTNVLHGYFLAKALGAAKVSFYGEPNARIAVLPDSALDAVPKPCDVLVNKDSMPEMPEQAMLEYLQWGRLHCRGIFYSYNQEAAAVVLGRPQNVVSDGVRVVGGFRRIRRDPSWLRRGYVEEIYVKETSSL